MSTFILAFFFFIIVVLAMAIGYMVQKKVLPRLVIVLNLVIAKKCVWSVKRLASKNSMSGRKTKSFRL
jgi:hypothetical protein